LNMEALGTFFESLTFAANHGYEPQTDYRKHPSLDEDLKFNITRS